MTEPVDVAHPVYPKHAFMYQEAGKWGRKFRWLDGATHANSFDRKRLDADWQRACDEATANYDDARKAAAQGVASGLATFKDLAAAFITYQQVEIADGERTPERVKLPTPQLFNLSPPRAC
jgi:hypothetical protein